MRCPLILRQRGTVRTVDSREYGILAVGRLPSSLNIARRQAHPVGWLMTGDAGPAVGSERRKKRMTARIRGAFKVQRGDDSALIGVAQGGGELSTAARRPPRLAIRWRRAVGRAPARGKSRGQ